MKIGKNERRLGILTDEEVIWLSISCYECCAAEASEPVDTC
jgi:hypothetical protein